MSASGSPSGRDDRSEGLTKYVNRVKTVLRRGKSNRGSISGPGDLAGDSSASTSQPPSAKVTTGSAQPAPTPSDTKSLPTKGIGSTGTIRMDSKTTTQLEWAQALFAKYGLTLDPDEWISSSREPGERVEKPIRMRIRRQCHRCQTTFGADKTCSNCQHSRCKKCPRYPPKKSKEAREAKAAAAAATGVADAAGAGELAKKARRKSQQLLSIPSRTGGNDLVRKPITQRIRRNCHKCNTLFVRDATECLNCQHVRCKKCPRDPPKLKKYPDGYPGDVEPEPEPLVRKWKKPRVRIRWTCHSCSKLFMEGEKTCMKCGHDLCQDCTREPPKKVKNALDPEAVKRVEEKLAKMDLAANKGIIDSGRS